MNNNSVVLVDSEDRELGLADVTDAHLCPGMLHRAISILLYRVLGGEVQLLVCQRSAKKVRWPGFWTNPVCTHPQPGESYVATGIRRTKEELGIRIPKKKLQFLFRFSYQASYDGQICENELDSVFIAPRESRFYPDPEEISAYKWLNIQELSADIAAKPQTYTPWFRQIMARGEVTDFVSHVIAV